MYAPQALSAFIMLLEDYKVSAAASGIPNAGCTDYPIRSISGEVVEGFSSIAGGGRLGEVLAVRANGSTFWTAANHTLPVVCARHVEKVCTPGWLYGEHYCWQARSGEVTLAGAVADCGASGAALASPSSQRAWDFISSSVALPGRHTLIGLRAQQNHTAQLGTSQQGAVWSWADGHPWQPAAASVANGKVRLGAIHRPNFDGGTLKTVTERSTAPADTGYMCQRPAHLSTFASCPQGWVPMFDRCILHSLQNITWPWAGARVPVEAIGSVAAHACDALGGGVLLVADGSLAANATRIMLAQLTGRNTTAVEIHSNTSHHSQTLPFVCQIAFDAACAPGWVAFGGNCYKLHSAPKPIGQVSQYGPSNPCFDYRAQPAPLRTVQQMQFLEGAFGQTGGGWRMDVQQARNFNGEDIITVEPSGGLQQFPIVTEGSANGTDGAQFTNETTLCVKPMLEWQLYHSTSSTSFLRMGRRVMSDGSEIAPSAATWLPPSSRELMDAVSMMAAELRPSPKPRVAFASSQYNTQGGARLRRRLPSWDGARHAVELYDSAPSSVSQTTPSCEPVFIFLPFNNKFTCARSQEKVLSASSRAVRDVCPTSWQLVGGACVVLGSNATNEHAEGVCQSLHASTSIVQTWSPALSGALPGFLRASGTFRAWVGLHLESQSGTSAALQSVDGQHIMSMRATHGSHWHGYSQQGRGHLLIHGKGYGGGCVAASRVGPLQTLNCSETLPVVCALLPLAPVAGTLGGGLAGDTWGVPPVGLQHAAATRHPPVFSSCPSMIPSDGHSPSTTSSGSPSVTASCPPSVTASGSPSVTASGSPSVTASGSPSVTASCPPSVTASGSPSVTASGSPSVTASGSPSATVSVSRTALASLFPLPAVVPETLQFLGAWARASFRSSPLLMSLVHGGGAEGTQQQVLQVVLVAQGASHGGVAVLVHPLGHLSIGEAAAAASTAMTGVHSAAVTFDPQLHMAAASHGFAGSAVLPHVGVNFTSSPLAPQWADFKLAVTLQVPPVGAGSAQGRASACSTGVFAFNLTAVSSDGSVLDRLPLLVRVSRRFVQVTPQLLQAVAEPQSGSGTMQLQAILGAPFGNTAVHVSVPPAARCWLHVGLKTSTAPLSAAQWGPSQRLELSGGSSKAVLFQVNLSKLPRGLYATNVSISVSDISGSGNVTLLPLSVIVTSVLPCPSHTQLLPVTLTLENAQATVEAGAVAMRNTAVGTAVILGSLTSATPLEAFARPSPCGQGANSTSNGSIITLFYQAAAVAAPAAWLGVAAQAGLLLAGSSTKRLPVHIHLASPSGGG